MNRLNDRTIAVTGASNGIGLAVARATNAAGAQVWLADIDEDRGRYEAEHLNDSGGNCFFHKLDVTNPDAWVEFAEAVGSQHGHLDGLVNNAGISFRHGIEDTSVTDWSRVMEANLSSVFYGMKFMAPLMKRSTAGSIVNVSSIAGMTGYFAAGYGASKWGVRGLSKVGALEFSSYGIRVNSLHPGVTDTRLMASGDPRFIDQHLRDVLLGRLARPEEIANTVVFLLSSESSYITGTELVVDGGMAGCGLYHRIGAELKAEA